MKNFDKILADARTANTQGRYQDSESLFRKALDLQTKLLNEKDISIAETLMDLALNVSNQGRDEEALALFRRAEPIIQVSPMTLIELGLPLIKDTMRQIPNAMIRHYSLPQELLVPGVKLLQARALIFRVFLEKAQMPTPELPKKENLLLL